nr:hypothetical protein [Tanacetum cinerariifolium]
MLVARHAVDELIEFCKETEPSRYMNFYKLQQISEVHRFLKRMRDEAQSSRNPNSPMLVARHAVDELIEFCGETEPSRYMNFFKLQQIFEVCRFLKRMQDLFDSIMCLRDDKRVENEKLSLLNEMITMVEEDITTKEAHVSSG